MKTTATTGNDKTTTVKKTTVKTSTAKDTSHGKSSITDKSTPKVKTTVRSTTIKHPATEKLTAKNTTVHAANASAKTTAAKAPIRRKRSPRKAYDFNSKIVLYEHTGMLLNGFIILVGLFMVFEGILGFQSETVLTIFTTNTTHATIHLILGLITIAVGMKESAFGYSVFLGLLLATVGVLRFIPSTAPLVINYLNVNEAVAVMNISIGVIALLLSFTDTKTYHAVHQ
ncbi:DUF4383 domain-containing protein [Flavobacterium wongokense]|uniref:DUF4383 domain-containing protein n=1 Tax=Flavobacterium wongokense TaxID=2910674 RepID=UPI001F38CFAD|nr:DUF4383 domain-containing protein [Flavobacterium sp. WG47]MCF6130910.1 DUF4383 domain-containing protein [Flavobacterium sp. WG47]